MGFIIIQCKNWYWIQNLSNNIFRMTKEQSGDILFQSIVQEKRFATGPMFEVVVHGSQAGILGGTRENP